MEETKLVKMIRTATDIGKSCIKVSRNFAIAGLAILGVAVIADCVREALEWMDYDEGDPHDYSFFGVGMHQDSEED